MPTPTSTFTFSVVAAVTLGLTLSACSGSDDADGNEVEACSAITDLRTAIAAVDTLTAESAVEEVRGVRDDVQTSFRDLMATLDDVADDRQGALDDAYAAFNESVDGLPDDATLADALASLQEEAAAITSARAAVADDLGCQ